MGRVGIVIILVGWGLRHGWRHMLRHVFRHVSCHMSRHMSRHVSCHADRSAYMVVEGDGAGLGEALQDAREFLPVHVEVAGDGIGAVFEVSLAVCDKAEVVEHQPVGLWKSFGSVSCSHMDV